MYSNKEGTLQAHNIMKANKIKIKQVEVWKVSAKIMELNSKKIMAMITSTDRFLILILNKMSLKVFRKEIRSQYHNQNHDNKYKSQILRY